eukprot:TRINITY_DN11734_c0_g1_i2.p2 TRINITY_DN11734_c0_g1~~TRINITY_DN11734_c0_g1_i2.p2  ORF type:complete len:151 (+),score=56.13 TRINITY_DN11734_c0_g1_i2:17-469(+)
MFFFFKQKTAYEMLRSLVGSEMCIRDSFKTVKKFLGVFEDDIKEFYSLFESLDEGKRVDISGLEDPKIHKYLRKMFKYLKLDQDSKTKEYYVDEEEKHSGSLKQKIERYVEAVQTGDKDIVKREVAEAFSDKKERNEVEDAPSPIKKSEN